uniref:Uncharacterized protein n=1 Tax=Lactuca sativa TaxID=4236 RepID=A0A9R1VAN1_LACSA|nr:hypothetical protein LSAT_V11C500292180 [Lactuca sativa]
MKYEVSLTIIAIIIGFDMDEGWYSFYCRYCSKKVTKNDDDSATGPFHCEGCGGVSDVYGKYILYSWTMRAFNFFHIFRCVWLDFYPFMCSIQENIVSVHDDNLEAVDLEALISSSSARKHPIGIVATTYSLE